MWLRRHGVRVLLAAVLGALAAQGADWPQFRGLHRDGQSPETGLMKQWPPEGLTPLWTIADLGKGFSSAAVAQGRIYVTGMPDTGTEGVLYCFDLSGGLQWKQAYGPEWTGTYPGPRSTPTVTGGRLYLMSGLGCVMCFDLAGKPLWQRDVAKEFAGPAPKMGFNESLLVAGGLVLCTPGGKDASVVALDAATGEVRWTTPGLSDPSGYCSPILVERGGLRLAVTLTAASLVALDLATGAVVWKHPFDEAELDQNHAILPVYSDGRLYITSGHGKGGRCFEISGDGRAAQPLWTDTVLNTSHGGLVTAGGHVFGANAKGDWVCLALADGAVKHQAEGVGAGSVVLAEGMLYCYGEKGMLGLAPATPGAFALAGAFKITHGSAQHWPHPSISDGRLYIRRGTALAVFDIRAK